MSIVDIQNAVGDTLLQMVLQQLEQKKDDRKKAVERESAPSFSNAS